ncbi:MAG TPA: response regulator [Spirochaetes bacterium]|nr:response regulator [Spirochaetota bacterium]
MKKYKPVLLVEDDRVNVIAFQRAFKDLKITNRIEHAWDGKEALDFLKSTEHEQPALILLDLNLPRMSGLEFLKTIKQDKKLKMIPVVVLTSSRQDQDKIECFNLGVAGYMIKPADYLEFVEVVRTIDLYWTLSENPSEEC